MKRIHSIFDFYNFSSTKRNQYKISRGALGNGLKAILGMSYALTVEHYNHDNWNPVNIRTENKLYSIVLIVDKINGKDRPIYTDIKSEECVSNNNIAHTAVAIDIPTDNNSQTKTLNKLVDTFKNYTILNPHITMHITLNGKLTSFPRVQKVKSDWNNLDNIYHYSFTEFENLLFSVSKGKVTIYDFVRNIRLTQFSKLNKDDWHIPINEIQHDKTVARKLYDKLKELVGPKNRLELPYDMRIKFRKKAIIERLNQWGIEVESIEYRLDNRIFKSEDGEVQFP